MNILYYAILAFGVILLLYTAKGWFSAKRKINEYDVSENKFSIFLRTVKAKISLWAYYFTAGDKKNLPRSIIISCFAFFTLFVINIAYIKMNRLIFSALFFLIFAILVWKIGQRRNQKIFNAMFPEVIQILNAAATSGAGLLQALERCGKDLAGQLGEEFKSIHKRLAIGEEPMTVFEDSYGRYPYKEFYFFIQLFVLT